MKKLGIITGYGVYNYGTKLQAYAMQEIFRKKGFQTEIILYSEGNSFSQVKNYIKGFLYLVLPVFKVIERKTRHSQYIRRQYGHLSSSSLHLSLIRRLKAIESIDVVYTSKRFFTKGSLLRYSKRMVAVVCGSDQIWHPYNCSEFWTLQLVPEGVRRISYAPSLGVDKLPEEAIPFFTKAMKGIDSISVREVSGAQILQRLTEKSVHVVLDPTILVGRLLWDKVLINIPRLAEKDYCLCYLLGTSLEHRDIIQEVANKKGLVIYNFSHFKKYNDADETLEGEHLYDISPFEFVGLVSKAKFVITDSFHCSVFSLLYHKEFLALLRYGSMDRMGTNNRIYSFLGQFGLESRIVTNRTHLDSLLNSQIDYEKVEQIVAQKRIESMTFLDDALRGL